MINLLCLRLRDSCIDFASLKVLYIASSNHLDEDLEFHKSWFYLDSWLRKTIAYRLKDMKRVLILIIYVGDTLLAGIENRWFSTLRNCCPRTLKWWQRWIMFVHRVKTVRDHSKELLKTLEKSLNDSNAKMLTCWYPYWERILFKSWFKEKEKNGMARIPYTNAMGILMQNMMWTRPNNYFVVGVVSHFFKGISDMLFENNQEDSLLYTLDNILPALLSRRKHTCVLILKPSGVVI